MNESFFMRAFYLIVVLLGCSSWLAGQSQTEPKVEIDERLFEVYEEDYLHKLQETQPTIIQRWNFYLDNAYYIVTYPEEKGRANFPEIVIEDLSDFNILKLERTFGMTRDFESETAYAIAGTDKVLAYYSGKKFVQKLNEHLGRSPRSKK